MGNIETMYIAVLMRPSYYGDFRNCDELKFRRYIEQFKDGLKKKGINAVNVSYTAFPRENFETTKFPLNAFWVITKNKNRFFNMEPTNSLKTISKKFKDIKNELRDDNFEVCFLRVVVNGDPIQE